jgi:hypothetical protein
MPFKDLLGNKDLLGRLPELAGAASETVSKFVNEFNEALPTMRALGFTVKDLRVGMALIPEIGATLVASTDTVDAKKIKELIEKHPENKTVVGMLKALLLAYNVKQQVGDLPFKGVQIDVTMGLPPHIGVSFVSSTPASSTATAGSAGAG